MKLPSHRIALMLALAALVSGCAENRYCSKPQDYETAPSVPPIKSVGDMKVEPAQGAYIIPQSSPNPVPFGQKVSDPKRSGKTRWSCLDQPPPLPPPTAKP